MKYLAVLLISVSLLLSGCASVGRFPVTQQKQETVLSKNNYKVVANAINGYDTGWNLLGLIPIYSPSYNKAMKRLHEKVDMTDKSTALINFAEDRPCIYWILFSNPRISVTADVIEYTKD